MEIAEHLRRAGSWAWLLLILPLLAAGVSLASQRDRPALWTSSATVLTSPGITDRTGVQYIFDYQAALSSGFVIQKVAEATGVSAGEVSDTLTSAPVAAGSSLLEVSFSSEDREAAGSVPPIAARFALEALIQPLIDAANAQIAIAGQQYDDALRARESYTAEIGRQLPAQDYQSALSELASLRNAYELARIENRPTADGLREVVVAREAEVAELAPQVVEFSLLETEVDRTYSELTRLRFSLAATQAQLDAVESESTITPGEVRPENNSSRLIRPVLTAALVGFVVAVLDVVGLVFLFDRRRSGSRAARVGHSEPVGRPDSDLLPEDEERAVTAQQQEDQLAGTSRRGGPGG